MDWSPTEMQDAIKELSRRILREASDPWDALMKSDFLGLDDVMDVTTLLIEVGRTGARVPAFSTLVLGAPIAQFGSAPKAGTVLTAGLLETESRDPRAPTTRAENGKLFGEKICVPAATAAEQIVAPTTDGVYVAKRADCTLEAQTGTDDDALGVVRFEGTPAEKLGGDEVLDWWLPRVDVGVSALLLGLAKQALRLTAAYAKERQQFGRPIGMFQAVKQRAADAWIHTQAMEVTLWQAAWRVAEGKSSARERAIARYWASEGSHFVCAAAQHLHGGYGFDRDYDLHRYFLAAKQHEFFLGGANTQLETLGDLVAASANK
jgi:alkylation response protein AidB-like acyl-CoA dehydrogenase